MTSRFVSTAAVPLCLLACSSMSLLLDRIYRAVTGCSKYLHGIEADSRSVPEFFTFDGFLPPQPVPGYSPAVDPIPSRIIPVQSLRAMSSMPVMVCPNEQVTTTATLVAYTLEGPDST